MLHSNTKLKKVTRYKVPINFLQLILVGLLLFQRISSLYGQDSQTYGIQGNILDVDKNPIVGAEIFLQDDSIATLSNRNGYFKFENLYARDYTIQVSSLEYKAIALTVNPANQNNFLEIKLEPEIKAIEEVEVKANVRQMLQRNNSVSIDLVEEEFFKEKKAGSLMQTLSAVPGVSSMDIGSGLSKPVIRGMGYYRVVVAQNGIRQEGQQWSNHHGLSVDQNNVSHVELIKGPATLQYGSGAIGGVINILPAHVPLGQEVTGDLSVTAKSNNAYLGSNGNLSARVGDFYTHISASYTSFGDFNVPKTDSFLLPAPVNVQEAASHKVPLENTILNTAGTELAASATIGIVKKWGTSSMEFSYYNNKVGFFDWQGSKTDSIRKHHEENTRDINWPYQDVSHFAVRHFTRAYINKNKLELALGYQQNFSEEYDYLFDRTGNRALDKAIYNQLGGQDLSLLLRTGVAKVTYTINSLGKQQLVFGINSQYQVHEIDGYGHILPAYQLASQGGFVIHKYSIATKWHLHSGIRFDLNNFHLDEYLNPDPAYGDSIFNPDLSRTYPGLSLMLGINYLPDNKTIIKVNFGKSYRIPSAYELGAYGLHRHEGRFEKGDTTLNPEIAWQFDLGIDKKWDVFSASLSPFVNYFTNYLYLNPTAELRSEGQVYEYVQSQALLAGGELNTVWKPIKSLQLNLGAEYVYAVNLDLLRAVPFTPPPSINLGVKYKIPDKGKFGKSKIGLDLVKAFAQNYTVANELQTPGYFVLNAVGSTHVKMGKQNLELVLRCRNILNNKYYNHITFYRRLRIPEPGRNIQLGITMTF